MVFLATILAAHINTILICNIYLLVIMFCFMDLCVITFCVTADKTVVILSYRHRNTIEVIGE